MRRHNTLRAVLFCSVLSRSFFSCLCSCFAHRDAQRPRQLLLRWVLTLCGPLCVVCSVFAALYSDRVGDKPVTALAACTCLAAHHMPRAAICRRPSPQLVRNIIGHQTVVRRNGVAVVVVRAGQRMHAPAWRLSLRCKTRCKRGRRWTPPSLRRRCCRSLQPSSLPRPLGSWAWCVRSATPCRMRRLLSA